MSHAENVAKCELHVIRWNMHMVLLCLFWCSHIVNSWVHAIYIPISFRISWEASERYDYPCSSEGIPLGYGQNHPSITMTSQITGLLMVWSTVCSGADQRKHQSSTSLAFVRGNSRWPENSSYQRPVTRKMFTFVYVIMETKPQPIRILHQLCPQFSDRALTINMIYVRMRYIRIAAFFQ